MAAAVVKLDALPDAVRSRAQDDDLLPSRGRGFIFFVVAGVEIRREALKLRRAGVHKLVDGTHTQPLPQRSNRRRAFRGWKLKRGGQPFIGQTHPLGRVQLVGLELFHTLLRTARRHQLQLFSDLLHLVKEPGIHARVARYIAHAHSGLEGVAQVGHPLWRGGHQPLPQPAWVDRVPGAFFAGLERAHGLHESLFEGAPDGHDLAHRLHLRSQTFIGSGKLLKLPLRNLHHHIIDGGLEARRRRLGYVVLQLIERIAYRQPRRDLRNRKPGRLAGQRTGPRDTRIHLDHCHAAVVRVHRELHVTAASLHADLADYGDSRVAHALILAIGQSLRRRDRNRVARMHAHRIEVLDRADDPDVVLQVAHHLQLVLLPPQD